MSLLAVRAVKYHPSVDTLSRVYYSLNTYRLVHSKVGDKALGDEQNSLGSRAELRPHVMRTVSP